MLFSKPKAILWIQRDSLSIFLLAKKIKKASFNLKLFSPRKEEYLRPLSLFFKENKIKQLSILLSEPLSGQQSFVYDAPADKISREETVGIAGQSFPFDIDNPYLNYDFQQKTDKTIIRVTAIDEEKLQSIQKNIQKLGIKVLGFDLVSSSLAKIFSRFHQKPFVLLHSLDKKKTLVLIANNSKVYYSELRNTSSLKIQPVINKVKMFFETGSLDKIFFQSGCLPDLTKDSKLHIVNFNSEDIAQKLKFSKELPLPVLGTTLKLNKQLIKIKSKNMTLEEKKEDEVIKLTDMENNQEDIVEEKKYTENESETTSVKKEDDTQEAFKILAAKQTEKSPKGKILALASVSALVTVVILTVFILKPFSKEGKDSTKEPLVQETPTQTPSPTATPTPKVLYEAKIKVQNGTSVSGLAGKLKTELTDLNFENLTSTNAPQKTDENTISCKEDNLETANFIKESLKEIYPATVSADLKEDDDYDIVITIGQDLGEKETLEETSPDDQTENGNQEE